MEIALRLAREAGDAHHVHAGVVTERIIRRRVGGEVVSGLVVTEHYGSLEADLKVAAATVGTIASKGLRFTIGVFRNW